LQQTLNAKLIKILVSAANKQNKKWWDTTTVTNLRLIVICESIETKGTHNLLFKQGQLTFAWDCFDKALGQMTYAYSPDREQSYSLNRKDYVNVWSA
jgi:hypothetical protein